MANSDEEDDDEDEYDDLPNVDTSNFRAPSTVTSFGWNKGRSSPSQRKAMGRSSSSSASVHICSNCASEFIQSFGRCPTCKEWGTLQEHAVVRESSAGSRPMFGSKSSSATRPASWLDGIPAAVGTGSSNEPVRMTDLYGNQQRPRRERITIPDDAELTNVLGGGIMPGSICLIGGDPGVGKSTLMLQLAGSLASRAVRTPGIGMGSAPALTEHSLGPVWYISGEENPDQIASRANRLGIQESELWLLSETHADTLCEKVAAQWIQSSMISNDDGNSRTNEEGLPIARLPPSLLIIDSIQTMICDAGGSSSAGGITQVRECVAIFLRLAKTTGIPIFLVGHVTKSGDVAGPRTVEHMVDCVLYLEGTEHSSGSGAAMNLRMLRTSKNRFGSSDEVGVYEMTHGRLLPVSDPSSLFLAHRSGLEDSEGCAIAIALEGMRAMTVEVQALVTVASGNSGYGRRTVDGIANSRLMLLLGVLQKRCRIFMARQDIYVNVAGRVRLDRGEGNAADLAVAISLVSSASSIPVRADTAFVGEVGLLGELRPIHAIEKRIEEARRMGFSRVVTPLDGRKGGREQTVMVTRRNGIEWIQCKFVYDALNAGLVRKLSVRSQTKPTENRKESQAAPETVEDLGLEEIMDDEDDDSFM